MNKFWLIFHTSKTVKSSNTNQRNFSLWCLILPTRFFVIFASFKSFLLPALAAIKIAAKSERTHFWVISVLPVMVVQFQLLQSEAKKVKYQ